MQRGALGARSLNADLQKALNPNPSARIEKFGSVFAPGDKIMQTENDYDRDVFNGDLGTVLRIDEAEGLLVAGFDGREVEYPFGELDALLPAYAMTIHKSQGSEYPAVVITLATQHYAMLARNLVYTAVTRGKRLVVIVGQRRAMAIAVRSGAGRRRWTKLEEWMKARAQDLTDCFANNGLRWSDGRVRWPRSPGLRLPENGAGLVVGCKRRRFSWIMRTTGQKEA